MLDYDYSWFDDAVGMMILCSGHDGKLESVLEEMNTCCCFVKTLVYFQNHVCCYYL